MLKSVMLISLISLISISGLCLFTAAAPAETLDSVYAAKLRRARFAKEVSAAASHYENLSTARLACRRQIEKGAIPAACFEALEMEYAWNLHSRDQHAKLRDRLDLLCAKAARNLQVAEAESSSRFLSGDCRKLLAEALAVIDYRRPPDSWSGN